MSRQWMIVKKVIRGVNGQVLLLLLLLSLLGITALVLHWFVAAAALAWLSFLVGITFALLRSARTGQAVATLGKRLLQIEGQLASLASAQPQKRRRFGHGNVSGGTGTGRAAAPAPSTVDHLRALDQLFGSLPVQQSRPLVVLRPSEIPAATGQGWTIATPGLTQLQFQQAHPSLVLVDEGAFRQGIWQGTDGATRFDALDELLDLFDDAKDGGIQIVGYTCIDSPDVSTAAVRDRCDILIRADPAGASPLEHPQIKALLGGSR